MKGNIVMSEDFFNIGKEDVYFNKSSRDAADTDKYRQTTVIRGIEDNLFGLRNQRTPKYPWYSRLKDGTYALKLCYNRVTIWPGNNKRIFVNDINEAIRWYESAKDKISSGYFNEHLKKAQSSYTVSHKTYVR